METELDYDYNLLTGAVQEAGDIARKFFGKAKKQWKKKFGEPVSEVDIKTVSYTHLTLPTILLV